jgi:hypothetical protein
MRLHPDQSPRRGVRGDERAGLRGGEEQVARAARRHDGRQGDRRPVGCRGERDLKQELQARDVSRAEHRFLRVVSAVLRVPVHLEPVVRGGLRGGLSGSRGLVLARRSGRTAGRDQGETKAGAKDDRDGEDTPPDPLSHAALFAITG